MQWVLLQSAFELQVLPSSPLWQDRPSQIPLEQSGEAVNVVQGLPAELARQVPPLQLPLRHSAAATQALPSAPSLHALCTHAPLWQSSGKLQGLSA